jgi:prevent-host-death family protein
MRVEVTVMPHKQYTPTKARAELFHIIKEVNSSRDVVEIVPQRGDEGVAVISLKDWTSIKETLFLEQTGVLNIVREREKDENGFTDADSLDWDEL